MYGSIIDSISDSICDAILSELIGEIEVGKVVKIAESFTGNVITGSATAMPNDDTKPLITEGLQFCSIAYSALSATNKLIIIGSANFSPSISTVRTRIAMFDTLNGTPSEAIKATSGWSETGNSGIYIGFHAVITAGSTASRTFTFRVGTHNAATLTVNGTSGSRKLGGVQSSGMIILEVEP